ncbi:hypothetical protein Pint_11618 [Pistacia integerrima]|uniref:Uncharacterized protein n=1 Tax=Pistacia integerrima TaxID=434235 RepID=A0ACC0XHA2_9ROSI|nr:hypothetical protein Pint_11618 [Pistacia integerrima]
MSRDQVLCPELKLVGFTEVKIESGDSMSMTKRKRGGEEVEDTASEEEATVTTNLMTRDKKNFGNNGRSKKRAAKKDGVREGANDVLASVDVTLPTISPIMSNASILAKFYMKLGIIYKL